MAKTPHTTPPLGAGPDPGAEAAAGINPETVSKYPVYQLHYKEQTEAEHPPGQTQDVAQPHTTQGQDANERVNDGRDAVVELDGIRVEPALGQSPAEAAVVAIARKAAEQNRDAVRVVVTTPVSEANPAGGKWFSIVTREGQVIEVPEGGQSNSGKARPGQASRKAQGKAPGKAPGKAQGPEKPLLIGGAVILGLAAVSAIATIAVTATRDQAPEPAVVQAWQVPNAGAQVPVGLPAGYAATADWAITVDDQAAPVVIEAESLESTTLESAAIEDSTTEDDAAEGDTVEGDMLALVDAEGRLSVVDAQTAQPVWHSTHAPRDIEALQVSTWAGHEVLIEAVNQQLRIWPIPQEPTEEPVAPTTVELAHQAEVSFAGEAPLIYLGDYVTLTDSGAGALTEVEIPAGAEPLLATDTEVVSIDAAHIYRTPINPEDDNTASGNDEDTASDSDEDAVSESVELSHHSAAQDNGSEDSAAQGPRAENVWTLSETIVAGIYEGADEQSLLQVFDLSTGDRIFAQHLENPPQDSDVALVDEQAQTAVIGSTALGWGEQQDDEDPVTELSESLQDPLLHGTTLWGTTSEGPAQIDITSQDAEAEHYEVLSDEDPAPVLVTDEAAYVAASRVDDTLLYRVNYAETGQSDEPKSTPSEIED